jgi:hypothetical protein
MPVSTRLRSPPTPPTRRNCAALQPAGIYSGTITIGGMIERSDIHRETQANPQLSWNVVAATLNPDDLAETLWRLYTERTEAEAVINPLAA